MLRRRSDESLRPGAQDCRNRYARGGMCRTRRTHGAGERRRARPGAPAGRALGARLCTGPCRSRRRSSRRSQACAIEWWRPRAWLRGARFGLGCGPQHRCRERPDPSPFTRRIHAGGPGRRGSVTGGVRGIAEPVTRVGAVPGAARRRQAERRPRQWCTARVRVRGRCALRSSGFGVPRNGRHAVLGGPGPPCQRWSVGPSWPARAGTWRRWLPRLRGFVPGCRAAG